MLLETPIRFLRQGGDHGFSFFFFFYSPFLLGAQISRYGLPTVFESMMWLLFLVGGGDVCRKGGKEEEEAVLQFSVLKL